jgi:hypothetical protein
MFFPLGSRQQPSMYFPSYYAFHMAHPSRLLNLITTVTIGQGVNTFGISSEKQKGKA